MKILLLSLAMIYFFSVNSFSQVAVIVNKGVGTSSLDAGKVSSIYNLNTKSWDNGSKIVLANLKEGAIKDKFFNYIKTPEAEMRKVWLKKKLSDGAEVPVNIGSEEEMLNFVKSTPGAIGFISKSKVTGDVKVVATID